MLGTGILAWFTVTRQNLPDFSYFKPSPVHALGLLQMIAGNTVEEALVKGASLTHNDSKMGDWAWLEGSKIIIFEDSVKGLQSGLAARTLLESVGIHADFHYIGVAENPIKYQALHDFSDLIIKNINEINWPELYI